MNYFTLTCFVIDSPNNNDNIFLNKRINRLLVDIGKTNYKVEYTDNFNLKYVILFAENIQLIKSFIDLNNLKDKKCVAITQEGFHEESEEEKINYKNNEIFIYCAFNKKFYLNNFYNFYGIPGGTVNIDYKKKENYNTKLYYFGNLWRQNWEKNNSLYYKRINVVIDGYLNKLITKIYSRDFYPIDNYDKKYDDIENKIKLINKDVIKNVCRNEKIEITKNQFYSLEFLPININNFTGERIFDSIFSGCVPVFMGHPSIKKYFPNNTIIYIDEFDSPVECFKYVKNLSYDDWKIRIEKCINILYDITKNELTGNNMIIQLFKNIVNDLFKNEIKFDNYVLCGGKCCGTTLTNTLFNSGKKVTHIHTRNGGCMFQTNFNSNFTYELILFNSLFNKVYVIDNYKLPFEREISSFIQNINIFVENLNELNSEELLNIFLNKYLYKLELYHPLDDLKKTLDIKIKYPTNEDYEKGYILEKKNNLILVKILDFSKIEKILFEIYGENINLKNLNITNIQNSNVNEFKKLFFEKKLNSKFLLDTYSDFYFNLYCKNKIEYINKYFNNNYYFDDMNKSINYLIKLFNSNIPVFLTRIGGTDFVNAYENNYTDEEYNKCCVYSGYFDNSFSTKEEKNMNLKKYYEIIKNSVDNSFVCINTLNNDKYVNNKIIISGSFLNDIYPFLNLFEKIANNKKILIVSPFSETIKHQFKFKDKLIKDYKYPDFELLLYDLPITYSNNGKCENINEKNWMNQSNIINEEINKLEFDIALISGASYTYSIGNYISNKMKKQAIYLGGILNILFAIKSNRYHVKNSEYEKINPKELIISPFEMYKIKNKNYSNKKMTEGTCAYFGMN